MFRKIAMPFALIASAIAVSQCGMQESITGQGEGHARIINTPGASTQGTLLVEFITPPSEIEGVSLEPLFPENGETVSCQWYVVRFPEEIPLEEMAGSLSTREDISRIQYNKVIRRIPVTGLESHDGILPATKADQAVQQGIFNDPYLSDQWHLVNTGDTRICKNAVEGADVSVKDAWRLTAGDPSIVVAILDEGVMYTHPDLADNIWTNTAELDGKAGSDDDNNGYADDIHGYNFASGTPAISWTAKEDSGHGTHVAGTVAAVNNNGEGVCGVAGGTGQGDGVRLMLCQIFDGELSSSLAVARAFRYAADNGAVIAQCSFGYDSGEFRSEDEYKGQCGVEYSAISYFLDKNNCHSDAIDGNVVIFSAGNEGKPECSYPGALQCVVSVTSFGPGFQPSGFTNYGTGCNISAPGGDYYAGRSGFNKYCQVLSTIPGDDYSGGYGWMEGTSMATPHVSGVAALGLSYAHKLGIKLSREDFISMLLTSVNNIDTYFTGTKPMDAVRTMDLEDYVGKMGTGAVDAWKLLMQIEGTPSMQITLGENTIDIASAAGDPASVLQGYSAEIDQESMKSLGITEKPELSGHELKLVCTRIGSGKLTIKAISEGITVTKELSIISRPAKSANGGWL
ncbi:MAG: S8 family serine peptidase [Clostridium sp.]|nr:S8 family serine peptidase [Bacteroides sp.]MCM1198603.1 S8 family serine peptidase [Clostridium sp.]